MDRFGADILKLAVMPKSDEDLMSLLTATVMMKRRTEKPVITMSMGKTGVLSRLCGEASGSAVTIFGGHQGLAPGQIPAEGCAEPCSFSMKALHKEDNITRKNGTKTVEKIFDSSKRF